MGLACLLSLPLVLVQGEVPQFHSVHVAFAEEHSADFVSGFGHIFVCLPETEISRVTDLLGSAAVNFGADTSPLGKGMWVGEYKLQTCHELVRLNTHFDQRHLTFFELPLTSNELKELRDDLGQLLDKPFKYDFFRHNCGHYIWDWLDGPENGDLAKFYLTPREALARILKRYPPIQVRVLRSDLEVLEAYLETTTEEARAAVAEALVDLGDFEKIEDGALKLLTIKVAESRAQKDDFEQLAKIRSETLYSPSGENAAQEIIAFQRGLQDQIIMNWPTEAEGPAFSAGVIHHRKSGKTGSRVSFEAGLRDFYTSPRPKRVLREVRFLTTTLDSSSGDWVGDFILASVSTHRDFTSLIQGASNGASAGYAGLPNTLDSTGFFLSTWGGLSAKFREVWIGGRLTVVADQLQDRGRLRINPGLSWNHEMANFASHFEIGHDFESGVGWLARQGVMLGLSSTLYFDWLRSTKGEDVLSISFQCRF